MKSRIAFLVGLMGTVVSFAGPNLMFWPFPFLQKLDTLPLQYQLWRWSAPLTAAFGLLALGGLIGLVRGRRDWRTALWVVAVVALAGGACYVGYTNSALRMFKPMETVVFASAPTDLVPSDAPVLGISIGPQARAYPLSLLAYHHVFQDELDGRPILLTYCIICRTARAFVPSHEGRPLHFRVIGAHRMNAILEDTETGSWWYQATGRSIAGPLEGAALRELALETMTLERWLELYPHSDVLQPDSVSDFAREHMVKFDKRRPADDDPKRRQWLTVVSGETTSKAYPWPVVSGRRLIQDELEGVPLAVYYHEDGYSHRVWDRRIGDRVLDFRLDHEANLLVDAESGTSFGFDGIGRGGELDGYSLHLLASTSEYRFSFEDFSNGTIWVDPDAPGSASETAADSDGRDSAKSGEGE